MGTVRWCRRGVMMGFLLLLIVFLDLNQIGLPEFAKRPLLEQLRSRGAELEFTRMRLRLGRGIVVEDVQLRRAGGTAGEQVALTQLQLKLRWSDLLRARVPTIVAVTVHGGTLALPLESSAGAKPFVFSVSGVEGRLRFETETHWILDRFEATCHGGKLSIQGDLVQRAPGAEKAPSPGESAWRDVLLRIGRTLEATQFRAAPLLEVTVHADLAQPALSTAHLRLTADGARHEALSAETLRFDASLETPRSSTNEVPVALHSEFKLEVTGVRSPQGDARSVGVSGSADLTSDRGEPVRVEWKVAVNRPTTPWVTARMMEIRGTFAPEPGVTNRFAHTLSLSAIQPDTQWGSAATVMLDASVPGQTGLIPGPGSWNSIRWKLATGKVSVAGGTVARFEFSGQGVRSTLGSNALPTLAWRMHPLEEWEFETRMVGHDAEFPQWKLDSLTVDPRWRGGVLTLPKLELRGYDGSATASVSVDARTREARARVESQLDVKRLGPVLGAEAARWLEQFGWSHESPPLAQAEASVRLPVWTNGPVDWNAEVIPTLRLGGHASVTNGSFRGVEALWASVPFTHTNRVWQILGAHIQRPDGPVELDFTEWSMAHDYRFRLKTAIDPAGVSPLFGDAVALALAQNVRFTTPPELEAELWGRWREPERTGVSGRLSAKRFNVRGQEVDEFVAARIGFTNGWLRVEDAFVRQGTSTATLPLVRYDIPGKRLYFTNALTTLSPRNVTRAIGPKTARALEPFEFAKPPTVMVSGVIPTEDDIEDADVRFETRADRFHWWRLTATNLAATVWWRGQSLIVTNLDSGFHGGRISGNLAVDFSNSSDSIFRFDSVLAEVQLRSLLAEVAPSTNRIDGIVGGRLTVREAHSRTNGPWIGGGVARLRDGFLWDLPLFGGMSSALDRIAPGIAQSRFNSGSASFSITNRTVRSQDMEFRSASMRLQATGTVDFDSRLDAVMRAELLRDVPLLGPLVSLALSPMTKLFEYDVRGTLGKPETSPSHVPSVLMAPLRPLQTFRSLMPSEPEKPTPGDPPKRDSSTPAPTPGK